MSDSPEPAENVPLNEQPNSSPVPGCIILATTLFVMGGLAVLYTVVFNFQSKRFAEFAEPAPREYAAIEPSPAQLASAAQALEALKTAAAANEEASVPITVDDLNVWIATTDLLADQRGAALVNSISEAGIEVAMAQPLRKGLLGDQRQYLNGIFVLTPLVKDGSVVFRVSDIRPENGHEMDPQFITAFSALEQYRVDAENESLAPVLNQIESVELGDGVATVQMTFDLERIRSDE